MYSTGKFAILYTGASPGLELTTYETCAPCNTCMQSVHKRVQTNSKENLGFFLQFFSLYSCKKGTCQAKINTGLFLRHLDFSCLSLTCMSFVFGKKFGTN